MPQGQQRLHRLDETPHLRDRPRELRVQHLQGDGPAVAEVAGLKDRAVEPAAQQRPDLVMAEPPSASSSTQSAATASSAPAAS